MESEFSGNIIGIRAVEDSIRATHKYTKGIFNKPHYSIQGEDFPNRVVTEYYDVYPSMKIGWNMSIIDAAFWLGGNTPSRKVFFKYNYHTGKAWMFIKDGHNAIKELGKTIPGFSDALAKVIANGNGSH